MTSSENQKKQDLKNSFIGCMTIFVILLLGIGGCSVLFSIISSKEQTSTEKLDEWFKGNPDEDFGDNNVYADCENKLKSEILKKTNDNVLMRDEYKKIGNYNTSNSDASTKIISWKFRAKIRNDGDYGDGFATCEANRSKGKKVSASFKIL